MLSMNESWKHYANWNELDTEGHVLCDFIYRKYPELADL